MGIHDEIREQQKKMKGKTPKEKLEYFWEYYKVHTIAIALVIIMGGTLIWDIISAKEDAFSATLLNAYGTELQNDFQADFAEYAGIDTKAYNCYIDATSTLSYNMISETDLAIYQRTIAMSQASDIDVLMGDLIPFTQFAGSGMLADLRNVLSEEEYAQYEPYFYYIDIAIPNDEDEDMDDGSDNTADSTDASMDHADPSAMGNPVPVGIYLPDSAKLKEFKCYTPTGETPILGFVFSSVRMDTARQFLHYLTE